MKKTNDYHESAWNWFIPLFLKTMEKETMKKNMEKMVNLLIATDFGTKEQCMQLVKELNLFHITKFSRTGLSLFKETIKKICGTEPNGSLHKQQYDWWMFCFDAWQFEEVNGVRK